MKKKILHITVCVVLIWFGIIFYQVKVSHNRCHEMGFARGLPASIPCYEEQQKLVKANFQEAILWPFENRKAVLLYVWNLGN